MAALKNEVKSFIVQALACFDTPSQVSQAVKQEFDVDVTRQQVEQHDPTKRAGSHLALKWQNPLSRHSQAVPRRDGRDPDRQPRVPPASHEPLCGEGQDDEEHRSGHADPRAGRERNR